MIFCAVAGFYGSQYIISSALTGARQQRAPIDSQARVGMIARVIEKSSWVVGAVLTSAIAGPIGLARSYGALGFLMICLGIAVGFKGISWIRLPAAAEGMAD